MTTKFSLYVHRADGAHGFLCNDYGVSPWRSDGAMQFPTVNEASAFARTMGWDDSTSAVPGATTAYVVRA